jgi:phenylacetate-CoA ligase
MDLLKPLVKSITHSYFLKRDGYDIRKPASFLKGSQSLSEEQIQMYQLQRLQELIAFSYSHNRFHRERLHKAGVRAEDIRSHSDLARIPVLTKDDIRNAAGNLFSDGYNKENTEHFRTGGSTGLPLHVYMDRPALAFKKAAVLRHNGWAHRYPGDRIACVWGDTDKPVPWRQHVRNVLTEREFYLDTLKFDQAHLDRFIQELRKFRPPILLGHAHSVFRLAQYMEERGIVRDFSFDGIITTAMSLSPEERRTIETVFRSPVFNRYGCEELSLIASECEAHSGLHIFAEGLIVEVIGQTANNPGGLLITDLLNRAMPMIRYEIGDVAFKATGPCSCGRGLPRLSEVFGRTADFLYTPDRRPVFGISILDTFIIHIPGIRHAQLVQERYDHIQFKIVPDEEFSDDVRAKLRQTVLEVFGPDMTYDIQLVSAIEQTQRGKYRFSICAIDKSDGMSFRS